MVFTLGGEWRHEAKRCQGKTFRDLSSQFRKQCNGHAVWNVEWNTTWLRKANLCKVSIGYSVTPANTNVPTLLMAYVVGRKGHLFHFCLESIEKYVSPTSVTYLRQESVLNVDNPTSGTIHVWILRSRPLRESLLSIRKFCALSV